MYTVYVQCTVYDVHCTMYIECTIYSVHRTFDVHCTLYIVQCASPYSECVPHTRQCTMYDVRCTLCVANILYTIVYIVHYVGNIFALTHTN